LGTQKLRYNINVCNGAHLEMCAVTGVAILIRERWKTIKLYTEQTVRSSNTGIGSRGRHEIRNWRTL
jgi:hypothetical protein